MGEYKEQVSRKNEEKNGPPIKLRKSHDLVTGSPWFPSAIIKSRDARSERAAVAEQQVLISLLGRSYITCQAKVEGI